MEEGKWKIVDRTNLPSSIFHFPSKWGGGYEFCENQSKSKMGGIIKDCTGVILAGGENTRMPVLKGFIEINGEKIIEKNIRIYKHLFKEVFISTNSPEHYLYLGVPMFGDIYKVRGPLTGIFTSLLNSSSEWIFVSACDMPFINERLIWYMASKRDDCDAVVPKSTPSCFSKGERDFVEPLFAFYSKRLISHIEKAILANKTGAKDFLANKKVKYIRIDEVKNIDVDERSFINLNAPKDLNKVQRLKGVRVRANIKLKSCLSF